MNVVEIKYLLEIDIQLYVIWNYIKQLFTNDFIIIRQAAFTNSHTEKMV